MGFKSTGVKVESVVFNGRTYRRYPESDNPAHRRYFARAGHRLHRDVWVHHNGPIPEGMHVHHIDGDTGNNNISNLACITKDEHWDEHRAEQSKRSSTPEQIALLARIRPSAAAWHRSPEGIEWHKQHAKASLAKTWGKPKVWVEKPFQCAWCGSEGLRKSDRRMYCCPTCQNAESRFRLGKSSYEHPYHASRLRSDSGG